MESPENVSVLVVAQPYLLATALADMLKIEGFAVRVADDPRPTRLEEHACVALLDATARAVTQAGATLRLPATLATLANGLLTVDLSGRRFKTHIARPRDLAPLIAALAGEAACCARVPLAAG
jgi:hypothetical protein